MRSDIPPTPSSKLLMSIYPVTDGVCRVHLSGELDTSSRCLLATLLDRLPPVGEPKVEWVLDLSALTRLDITGLDLLVWLRYEIRQRGGTLRLARLREQARWMLYDARLDRYFGPPDTT